MAVRLGLVGLGKIANDKHIPAIEAPDFELIAGASHAGTLEGLPTYRTLDEMLAGGHDLAAVAMCQPPQARFRDARAAIEAGLHVLLEKPPGTTAEEVDRLAEFAAAQGVTLFASWHARFAPAVEAARAWLAQRKTIRSVEIVWKEDVRQWHPGQAWIWEQGGFGVFDPGINALSIATRILPRPFILTESRLAFPANKAAPIAAELAFTDRADTPIRMQLDWRQQGPQTWDIMVETGDGRLVLSQGGKALSFAGAPQAVPEVEAYTRLYQRFARLIAERRSDVDLAPMRHVEDAFLRARRVEVEAFEE